MSDFTGEQKLRIVLESLLRDVPKKDQCKKYGISES
jgi:transposase-like protein